MCCHHIATGAAIATANVACSPDRTQGNCKWQCTPPEACLGGLPGNTCKQGYRNPYCNKCQKKPTKYHKQNGVCVPCMTFDPITIVIMGVGMAFAVYVLAKSSTLLRGITSPRILMNFVQTVVSCKRLSKDLRLYVGCISILCKH